CDVPYHDAVIGWVQPEFGIPQRFLHRVHRGTVEGLYEHGTRLGDGDGGELLQRGHRTGILDEDFLEHPRVGAPAADVSEVFAGDVDGLVRRVFSFEGGLLHAGAPKVCPAIRCPGGFYSVVTRVPISAPRSAWVTWPGSFMPNTRIGSPLSRQSANAVESTTRRSFWIASSKVM